MFSKFNSAKCETTCRLCLGRIKLLRNKRNIQIKTYRKEIADLLRGGKQDYARIRVEAVIRESQTLQAYELLELFLELLAVRAAMVANSKEIPRDMVEALSSVLYAASRVPDLPELVTLHKLFSQKFGKEYAQEASSDVGCARWNVNERLRRCVTVEPPEPALKLEVLSEIAQEHGVEWDLDRARREMLPPELPGPRSGGGPPAGNGGGGGGGALYAVAAAPPPAAAALVAPAQPQLAPVQVVTPQAPRGAGVYQDAHQAALAAAAAAAEAARAAEFARHLAGGTGSPVLRAPVAPSSPFSAASGPRSPVAGAAAPPPAGWLLNQRPPGPPAGAATGGAYGAVAGVPHGAAGLGGVGTPPGVSTPTSAGHAGGSPAAGSSSAAAAAFHPRPIDEIQRAYDEAQGPPVKPGEAAYNNAANHQQGPFSPPSAPAAPGPAAEDEELPDPPRGGPGSGAGAGGSGGGGGQGDSEFDELQRRFDMLKRA